MKRTFWQEAEKRVSENARLSGSRHWRDEFTKPFTILGLQFWKAGMIFSGIVAFFIFFFLHDTLLAIAKGLLFL